MDWKEVKEICNFLTEVKKEVTEHINAGGDTQWVVCIREEDNDLTPVQLISVSIGYTVETCEDRLNPGVFEEPVADMLVEMSHSTPQLLEKVHVFDYITHLVSLLDNTDEYVSPTPSVEEACRFSMEFQALFRLENSVHSKQQLIN